MVVHLPGFGAATWELPSNESTSMIEYETYQPGDDDEVLVIEVGGRLDTMSSEYLVDCVKTHTDRGARKIVLDCT